MARRRIGMARPGHNKLIWEWVRRLLFWSVGAGRCEWQPGGSAENASFLRRELPPISVAVNLPLPGVRRHRPQGLNGISHRLSTLRRQLLHLRMHLARRVFLIRGQVAERVHTAQHLLPLLGRQTVKPIQLVLQMLLLLWRKVAELRIVLQRPFLLFGWQIVMLAQPLSGVALLSSWGTGSGTRRAVFLTVLRPGRSNPAQRQGKSHYRANEMYPHFPPVYELTIP